MTSSRRQIARLVPQPGQNTSNQGVPAISAARIVGDHSMSRLETSCSFQRSMKSFASARAAASETCRSPLTAMSRPVQDSPRGPERSELNRRVRRRGRAMSPRGMLRSLVAIVQHHFENARRTAFCVAATAALPAWHEYKGKSSAARRAWLSEGLRGPNRICGRNWMLRARPRSGSAW
jgi:hypothetical protein